MLLHVLLCENEYSESDGLKLVWLLSSTITIANNGEWSSSRKASQWQTRRARAAGRVQHPPAVSPFSHDICNTRRCGKTNALSSKHAELTGVKVPSFSSFHAREVKPTLSHPVTHVAWSCDGRRLASVGSEKAVRLWSPEKNVSRP